MASVQWSANFPPSQPPVISNRFQFWWLPVLLFSIFRSPLFFLQALGLAYAPDGRAKLAKYFDTPRLRRPKCAPPADATCLRLFPGTICFRGRLIASFIAAILRLLSFVPRRRCQCLANSTKLLIGAASAWTKFECGEVLGRVGRGPR